MIFDPAQFNRDRYEQLWSDINTALEATRNTDGLPAALQALNRQQFDQGFIQDDLSSVVRCRLADPHDHSRAFTVQYNPRRADRGAGAGRPSPPPGTLPINGGCFLDRDNICWQQRGIELGFNLTINETAYIAWMNPFPLMQLVFTTELEKQNLDSGRVDCQYLKQVLAAVEAPGVREFVRMAV